MANKNAKTADKRREIVRKFANLNKKLLRRPTEQEMLDAGYARSMIRHYFPTVGRLEAEARDQYPDCFFDVGISEIINQDVVSVLRDKIKAHKRFVITSAVTGCQVDQKFYKSIKTYCAANDAILLVLIASDPAQTKTNKKGDHGTVDSTLVDECIVFEDTDLNSNLFLSTIKLSAKHIDPTTGLDRIGQRDGSFIFASPKQRLQMVATSNIKLPHALMTTGAITLPNYKTDSYMSERTAYIADHDHVMGAIIVEIQDDSVYHYRQVQASRKDGSFHDLGRKYGPQGVSEDLPVALVLGDWHSGETDPVVVKCTEEMISELKPRTLVLHDAFNGLSINHHEDHNLVAQAIRYKNSQLLLKDEIQKFAEDLEWLSSKVKELVIVKSNHDEFLSKHYLAEAKYVKDPHNHYYCLELAKAMIEGHDPLRYAVFKINSKLHNVLWLQRDQDFKIAGIQLGSHGDKGPNGSRGSLRNVEKAFGDSITGHSHTPGILRGAWSVGTSSFLKLGYNQGPSSWVQAHCLVYANGDRQILSIINGRWRL
jgi:hypothetical protein